MWRPSQNLAKVGADGSNPFARSSPTSPKFSPARLSRPENPSIGGLSGTRLECAEPERCGKSLSEAAFLSGRWDLGDFPSRCLASNINGLLGRALAGVGGCYRVAVWT